MALSPLIYLIKLPQLSIIGTLSQLKEGSLSGAFLMQIITVVREQNDQRTYFLVSEKSDCFLIIQIG